MLTKLHAHRTYDDDTFSTRQGPPGDEKLEER